MSEKLVIEVSSKEELENFKNSISEKSQKENIKFKFKCEICSKEVLKSFHSTDSKKMLCHKHLCEKTLIEKYGSLEKAYQENKSKGKETNLKKYGVENPFQLQKVIEKTKNRTKEEWGKIQESRKKTLLEKYGVENASQSEAIKQKKKETTKKHFGVEYSLQIDIESRLKKREKTFFERYGVKTPMEVEEFAKKAFETRFKNDNWQPGNYTIGYFFNNIHFDSSWELAYYIWLSDNKIDFEYHPKSIIYFDEYDGKKHRYYPDFKVNGKLQEIKGNQFFDENNNLIDFYGDKHICFAKMKCLRENNVEILREENLKEIFEYINSKYGKKYLESFKNLH